jgi:cytochrome c2
MRNGLMITPRMGLFLIVAVLSIHVGLNAQTPDQAQIEKGRMVVAQTCAACHTTITRMVQIHKQTPEEWRSTVYFMISRGAQIMPNEIDSVVAFLSANGGQGGAAGTQVTGAGRGGGRGGADAAGGDVDPRTLFQRTCQQCHELATASNKQPSEEWSAVISRMVSYGARLNSADQQKLIGYLTNLPK